VIVVFIAGTSLAAAHMYVLPTPAVGDPMLARAVNGLRAPDERDDWLAVHVLYAHCRCSRRIIEHLSVVTRPGNVQEKLLIVGERPDLASLLDTIASRGIDIVEATPAELRDRFHVEGVPLLLVLAPDGRLRYAGGYTERKQGPNPRDVHIILCVDGAGLVAGRYPVLQCLKAAVLFRG
jgi:hypothetical protein